jgi:hypothetical protein
MTTVFAVRRALPGSAVRRLAYLLAGIVLIATAIRLTADHDLGPFAVVFFALMPDLAFLAAIGQPHQRGQLPARAVRPYNTLHHPAAPAALAAVAAAGILGPAWLVAGLAWLAHIGFDRAAGYGPRTPDGWQRG